MSIYLELVFCESSERVGARSAICVASVSFEVYAFFKSGRQPEAQGWKVCESFLYGSCCEVPLRSLDDT